jgi:aryl carrier-like protein
MGAGPMDNEFDHAGAGQPAGDHLGQLIISVAVELLDNADVTLDDDFFSLGGDSILAMHLVGQLARQTGLRVRVSMIFANPKLTDFARAVGQLHDAGAARSAPSEPLAAALRSARSGDGGEHAS